MASTAKKSLMKKQAQVSSLTEILKDAQTVVAFEYQGLTVENLTNVRTALRENDCEMKVYKNNIVKRAAVEAGLPDLQDVMVGALALVTSASDVVTPAKIVFEFASKLKQIKVVGGVIQGEVVDSSKIKDLSMLPSRETLLTQLAFGLTGPLHQLTVGLHLLTEQKEENLGGN